MVDQDMTYEIAIRSVEPTAILYRSARVPIDGVGGALAEMLPAVFGYVMENGLAMAGPPVVRYVGTSPAFVSIEAGVPLSEEAEDPPADTAIRAGWLHGGTVAATIHRGPYETIGDAHVALDRWMDTTGLKPIGAPWGGLPHRSGGGIGSG